MTRRLWAIGSISPDSHRIALYCAWGGHWFTPADAERASQGADVSHGCCEDHVHLVLDNEAARGRGEPSTGPGARGATSETSPTTHDTTEAA